MSDTPRTDRLLDGFRQEGYTAWQSRDDLIDHARALETELVSIRKATCIHCGATIAFCLPTQRGTSK